ncbi:MAG: hypothetical protein U0R50_13075 [Gaiellales bacterium]
MKTSPGASADKPNPKPKPEKPKPESKSPPTPRPDVVGVDLPTRPGSVGRATTNVVRPAVVPESTSRAQQVWNRSLLALLTVSFVLTLVPGRLAAYGSVGRGIVTARFGFLAVALGALFILAAPLVGEGMG